MAFFRFSRDKRGYENFYLVHPTTRRGKSRMRVLYWFRTPPGLRVGREPFDEGVRRALELQNPDVTFDWPQIIAAPIPTAETERWRDRRRAEKAARQAAAEDEAVEEASVEAESRSDERSDETLTVAPAQEIASAASAGPVPESAIGGAPRRKRRRRGRRSSDAPRNPQPHDAVGSIAVTDSPAPQELRSPRETGERREPGEPPEISEPRSTVGD